MWLIYNLIVTEENIVKGFYTIHLQINVSCVLKGMLPSQQMNGIKCLIKVSHSLLARNDLTFNSTLGPKASIVFILKEFNEEYYFLA